MVLVRKKKRKNRVCLDVVVSCQVMNGNCGDDSGLNYKLGRILGSVSLKVKSRVRLFLIFFVKSRSVVVVFVKHREKVQFFLTRI